jgi:hypothetical protein
MTRVVNLRKEDFDVYIGRGSKWGNPYTHLPVEETMAQFWVPTREEAIKLYRDWLWAMVQLTMECPFSTEGDITVEDLASLHGKTLGCFCKPQSCHGDILVRAAAWAVEQLGRG